MKKFAPHILTVCLTVGFLFLGTDDCFSQSDQTAPYVTGITAGRARSLVGVALGLISLIIGWRAKRRSAVNPGSGRSWSIAGLVLGLTAIVLSIIHLANVTGGFGTGGGKAGAIVALVLGIIGATLSGIALRSNR